MTKSEIIKVVYQNNNLNYVEIEKIVNQVFDVIAEGIVNDDKVVISGFGTFEKYYQEGYNGLNPSTGEKLYINGSYKVRFNASRKLKEATNKK